MSVRLRCSYAERRAVMNSSRVNISAHAHAGTRPTVSSANGTYANAMNTLSAIGSSRPPSTVGPYLRASIPSTQSVQPIRVPAISALHMYGLLWNPPSDAAPR